MIDSGNVPKIGGTFLVTSLLFFTFPEAPRSIPKLKRLEFNLPSGTVVLYKDTDTDGEEK